MSFYSRAKPSHTWKESSLDSIDTASTASRKSEDSYSVNSADGEGTKRQEVINFD